VWQGQDRIEQGEGKRQHLIHDPEKTLEGKSGSKIQVGQYLDFVLKVALRL
jgi:hypothetical protein